MDHRGRLAPRRGSRGVAGRTDHGRFYALPHRRGSLADIHPGLPNRSVDRRSRRPLEARSMKIDNARRFTSVHQSLTFSRRMAIAAGAQTAVGALLIGRLGWLSVAENQRY